MFIKQIRLNEVDDKSVYPFNIPVLRNFTEINFTTPVTFFVGENGSGKSTLTEAIAVGSGMSAEGGSQNFNFHTNDTHSLLYEHLVIARTGHRPSTKYFLRAESFYNVASEIERLEVEDSHGGSSLHHCSHGEAFIQLIENRFFDKGLYILDEPESALSPLKQMRLLVLIDELVRNGSQFIIATHSPILLSYPDARILDFDNHMAETMYKETEHYKLYKLFLDNPEMMIKRLLDD